MKNFSKTLLVIMIGTMGISSCADSWEEMRKEKYEKEWVKTFGEVDPNHTWNLATQVTADLAIKEDALTEYTFKVYTSDPIWGTDAKLLAKATVKTDEVGYAETQIKFDAPSSQERYYITRTDSHGRRLLKVSDIENKKIGVKFGISNYSAESRGLYDEVSFENLKIENPYTEDIIRGYLEDENLKTLNDRESSQWNVSQIGGNQGIVSTFEDGELPKSGDLQYTAPDNNELGKFKFIINHDVNITNRDGLLKEFNIEGIDVIINKGATLTLKSPIYLAKNSRIFILEGGTLNAYPGTCPQDEQNMNAPSIILADKTSLLYNAGTLNVDYLRIQDGTLYNAETGVLPGYGDPDEDNPKSFISFYNNKNNNENKDEGILTNFGKINVYRIYGNTNYGTWANAAKAEQNGTVNNGCFIHVEDRFCIEYLNVASNSSIESLNISINSVTLRPNSILKSQSFGAQNATWKFVVDDNDQTTGNALISTEEVNYIHDGGVTVEGPIYFETNGYNAQQNYLDENNKTCNTYKDAIIEAYNKNTLKADAAISTVGNAPILIIPDHNYNGDDVSKYDCVGHGNIPQEFQTIIDKNIEWAIAFEDLGDIGDYDFNDVVIGVSQDGNKIKVTALAAGGTLPAYVYYKGESLGEIHELLNRAGDYSPINVKNKRNEESGKRKIYEIDPAENFSIETNWTDFTIRVNEKESATITPSVTVGNVPQALCIPSDWLWPKESINIRDAYADFTNWVQNQENYKTWYLNHTDGKVAVNQ